MIFPELHAALGYGFALSFRFLLPAGWFWYALLALEVVLLNKELWFDPWREGPTQPFLWEGVRDFLWYHAGYSLCALTLLAVSVVRPHAVGFF